MKSLNVLSVAMMLFMASCCSTTKTMTSKETSASKSLYETHWTLKKMHTNNGIEKVNTKAFIKFDEAKQSAGGNGSCNSFGSTISVEKNKISFKNTFSTKMYCVEVQKTEDTYFNLLEKVNRFEIKDKILSLYQDKNVLLEFVSE